MEVHGCSSPLLTCIRVALVAATVALVFPSLHLADTVTAPNSGAVTGNSGSNHSVTELSPFVAVEAAATVVVPTAVTKIPDEQRLLHKLMANYDQSVRPVYNITHSVLVNFSLTLVQIMDMVSWERQGWCCSGANGATKNVYWRGFILPYPHFSCLPLPLLCPSSDRHGQNISCTCDWRMDCGVLIIFAPPTWLVFILPATGESEAWKS